MTLNQRIKLLRKTLGLSQTEFASAIGITQTSLSQIESGKNGISYDVFHAMVSQFKVAPFWLMDGDGSMFPKPGEQEKNSALPLVVTVAEDGDENIVLVDQKAAAGYLEGMHDREYVQRLPAFRLPGFRGKTYRAFEVSGDSMMPTVWPNDLLVCSYVEAFSHIRESYVHVVVMNDGSIVAKRVFHGEDKDRQLLLKSDNPAYPPYSVQKEEVAQVWRVNARITGQLPAPDGADQRLHDIEKRVIQIEQTIGKRLI